jgi:predicted ribosomally synthesized peptide with nif11-like leader
MSKDNAIAFVEKINTSPELLEEIHAITNDLNALVALGQREGFDFSAHELKNYLKETAKSQGELSDAELEQVAGGGGGWPPPETHPIICDGEFYG